MMSTNMVFQDVQSIIPVAIQQTIPPSPSVPIPHDETAKEINKPILNTLLTSRECLGKSSAPTVQPLPMMEMLPAVTPASSAISVPTTSISNKKYAVVVATVGGVVTKTFLMPVTSAAPSIQAPRNLVMPSINRPSQTPSAPGGRIIIQCPTRKNGQNTTSLLSPQTIQSSKPVFSYNPANIIVKTPACPAARSIPPIVHNNCNQTVLTVMPQLPTSHLRETNVSLTPVNDIMSISPIVIAPTTPQKSPPPIVIAPTTPQKSPQPIVITPTTPQKSRTPILITPVVSQKSSPCRQNAANNVPFYLAQSLARHVIHGNDKSQTVEHWDAEKGITNIHTPIPSSEQEQNSGSSGLGKIASVYSEQDQNNGGNELGLRIDSVYSEQDQNNGGNELGLRIDSVYSEQDQNDGGSELALRIDSVYSEQEQNDGVGELAFRIDNAYSEQEQSDGALGLRIDNVFSLAEEERSAFHDGVPSHNIDHDDNSMVTDADSESTELFSESQMLQTNGGVSSDTESMQGSDEGPAGTYNLQLDTDEASFAITNTHFREDASPQTDLTSCQDFQQNPRKYHFEDEIKQILTERTEERKLGSKDHITTRLEYLPMNTDATCDELLQPETRFDITSEEILDSELERIIPEMVIPDAVTPSPVKDGLTPLDKRCVARKRCTQVSKYFQHRNQLSKPIRRCSVLTPKLVVEEDEIRYDVESVQCSCGIRLSDIKKEHAKRQELVNSINHDHTYSGDCMSDVHNTSDISTDSASSGGYHWSSEDEDGGIHVRGEAILEVITVTPETVLADSTLKNILWVPLRKKRKKKLKPSPNPLSVIQKSHIVIQKPHIVMQKSHIQSKRLIYTKDEKTHMTFQPDSVKARKAPTDRVVVGGVEWNVEPKQPIVDPEDRDKSFGWILSKDEGSSLDDTSLTSGSQVMQTCSSVPAGDKQNLATSSIESSPYTSSSNKQQNTQPQVPKTLCKLVLKRENSTRWTISGRDASQEHVRKDHRCDRLTETKANKESEANKETFVKHIGSEKPQSEQTCSTAVRDNTDDNMNLDMPKLLGKRKRGRPSKHPKGSTDDKRKQRLGNDQQLSCSSHSDSEDSIFGEHQVTIESEVDEKALESEVDEKAHDAKQQNIGKVVTFTNNCSNDGMVSMSTEKPLNGEQQSAMEGAQSCTYESDEKDSSNPHFSSTSEDNSATLPQNISNTILQNEKSSSKIASSNATNLGIPQVRKRGRPRKYAKDTADELSKRKCERLNNRLLVTLPTSNDKDNGILKSEDPPSESPLTLDLSPECKICVIDLPPEVMGRLGITDDPQSVNQSLVDSLNEILPLINSEKEQVNIASDADAFPGVEDANRGLSCVIVDPASQEKRSESPGTDNSCSAAGPVRSIEHLELNNQGNVSAIAQGTSTQDIVKQGKTTKGLSRIEQLKAKLKQQEEALQLVRQQREESKKVFESIDMV